MDAPLAPGGHLPCRGCGRFGGENTEPDENGVSWAITGPRDVEYEAGDQWTCTVCRKGRGQASHTSKQKAVAA